MKNNLNPHSKEDNHQIVSNYFSLIDKKDMRGLLNLFTDDCVIYEPFSRDSPSYNNDEIVKSCLNGRSEIESFFNIVMMASDGLLYEIEFIDDPIDIDYKQTDDIFDSTSSSIVSALATFYGNQEGDNLKERLTFHVVSKKGYDSNYNISKWIKTLRIQFCPPESTS
jgi:hypothetical protein